ncbi:MAG: hypothetical protein JNK67_13925 [Alphaproteobacteria bacterium]|nr:hypothetical protein [Alphaproteobacteria bacterium]
MRSARGDLVCRPDPARVDLAREFRAKPFGGHSVELQQLLHLMRAGPIEGRHFLYINKPHQEWTLARMSDTQPLRPILVGPVFTDLAAAEWHVFKLRWQQLTGQSLAID